MSSKVQAGRMTTVEFQEWLTDMATELTNGKMFATQTTKKWKPTLPTGSKIKRKKALR